MPGLLKIPPRYSKMLRRVALGSAALFALVAVALAGMIFSRDYASLEQVVLARYEQDVGLVLRAGQRRHVMWPKPKFVYEDVLIRRVSGDGELKAQQATIHFDLLDLIDGRIDGPSLSLVKPEIRVDLGRFDAHFRSPRSLTQLLDQVIGLFGNTSQLKRLRLAMDDARITFLQAGPRGDDLVLENVRGRMRYLAGRGRLDFDVSQGSATNGFSLAASLPTQRVLAETRQAPASIQIEALGSKVTFGGSMRRDPDLALIGRVEAQVGAPLESRVLDRRSRRRTATDETSMSIASSIALDPRGVALEALKIIRGGRQLGGIAALRETNNRWSLSATLAGDLVDGSAANAALQRLRLADGRWSLEPLSINPLPMLDLDIRLSTSEFKLGDVSLSNVALSILTRQGRAEMAIVDSRFGEGMVKARVSLIEGQDRQQELRLQGSAERIDFGRFMERAFAFNRLTGEGTLVLQAEAKGNSIAGLASALGGTAAIDIKKGEIVGIDLARLLNRASDARPDAALILSLAGKTSFDMLRTNFAIRDGKIEPVGSSFVSPRVNALLEGAVDLGAQRHQLAVILRRRIEEPPLPSEFYAFRMEGPLFAPSIRPDLRLLQNRS